MGFQLVGARKFVLGALAAAGIGGFMSTDASAVFNPGPGIVKFKLTDGANLYSSGDTPDPRSDAFPATFDFGGGPVPLTDTLFGVTEGAGLYEAALNTALVGARDFTAFEITSFRVGDNGNFQMLPVNLTGIATFLEVEAVTTQVGLISGRQITLALGDDESRPHQLAGVFDPGDGRYEDPLTGNPTVGRIFLFENDDPNAGDFAQTNSTANDGIGGTPSDVLFSSGLGTVDCGGFECDALDNFTGGTLVATGSFVGIDHSTLGGIIVDMLSNSDDAGVSWTGLIPDTDIVIDGGVWFDMGVLDRATFQVNQFGFDDSGTNPIEGDDNVFAGGWQISSEDPITYEARNPIPEPVTSGLTLLALGGLSGYLRRRRMA